MKTMRIRPAAILMLSAALGLSACNRTPDRPSELVDDNMTTEVPIDDAAPLNSADAAPPATEPLNVTNTAAPLPAFTDSQQMRDDADATGLTSRLPSEESPVAAANDAQPVQ